jgi:hypothetical protein
MKRRVERTGGFACITKRTLLKGDVLCGLIRLLSESIATLSDLIRLLFAGIATLSEAIVALSDRIADIV